MEMMINKTQVSVIRGDLASQQVDALIHPTNNYLWFSSLQSEVLKLRGGESLEQDATALGPIEVGDAVIMRARRLKSNLLIHAAAWGQDMMVAEKQVHRALAKALQLARENKCRSLAVSPSGLCVGGFPLARAMETTFLTLVEHCLQPTTVEKVILLAANAAEEEILNRMLQSANAADPPKNEDNV